MSVIEKDGKRWELVKVDSSTVRRKLLPPLPSVDPDPEQPVPMPERPAPAVKGSDQPKRGPGRSRKAD